MGLRLAAVRSHRRAAVFSACALVCLCVLASSWQVDEAEAADTRVDDSRVWVPAEEPIINSAFLFDSKIWEICQELPIHWIHPSHPAGEKAVGAGRGFGG